MDRKELRELVARILDVGPQRVTDQSVLSELGWDSLADLAFIAEVDTKLNVTVASIDLSAADTVGDLAELIHISD